MGQPPLLFVIVLDDDLTWVPRLRCGHAHQQQIHLRKVLDEPDLVPVERATVEDDQARVVIAEVLDTNRDLAAEVGETRTDLLIVVEIRLEISDLLP